MSNLGAMCRNCSLSFCKVDEFLASSDTYCLEPMKKVDRKIRSRTSARFVPRCGVARNVIEEMALIIDSYSGSFWPCIYACVLLAYQTWVGRCPHLLDYEPPHTMDHKQERHLVAKLVLFLVPRPETYLHSQYLDHSSARPSCT